VKKLNELLGIPDSKRAKQQRKVTLEIAVVAAIPKERAHTVTVVNLDCVAVDATHSDML